MTDVPHDPETERLLTQWETYCRRSFEQAREHDRILASLHETQASPDAPWWVAIARPSQELTATSNLRRLGFEVWWPIRIAEVRMSRVATRASHHHETRPKTHREFPAMPGYLFVRHSNPRAWPGMIDADGVVMVLCNPTTYLPSTISAEEIERQKARLAPLAVPVVEDALCVGERLIITEGPFAGLEAIVSDLKAKGAVEVQLSVFGTQTRTRIEREKVERTGR